MRTCTSCRLHKPDGAFAQDGTSGRVLRRCRDCINEKRRARWAAGHRTPRNPEYERRYRTQNKAKVLDAQRKSKYGLRHGEYDEMVRQQNGCCAICDVAPEGALQIDHDHVTGRVRGLLCGHCNKALGLFRDNPERLLAAFAYLKPLRKVEGL